MSSHNMKEFMRWVLGRTLSLRSKVLAVLRTKKDSQRSQNFASIFLVTYDLFLRKAGREHARQILRAFIEAQIFASSDARVAKWSFTLFPKKASSPLL